MKNAKIVSLLLLGSFSLVGGQATWADQSVVAGSICQALNGSQDNRLTHNVDWIHNHTGTTWVTCPLVRDKTSGIAEPRVRVRVYRPSGTTALDCNFLIRSVTGHSEFFSDSAAVGWSYIDMQSDHTHNGALYSVRCRLPEGAGIQKIVLDE